MVENSLWRRQVGERLANSIAATGQKPADIARLFGVSPQRLSNYMAGSRPLDVALAMNLSDQFGITLDWLYLGDHRSLPYEMAQKIAHRLSDTLGGFSVSGPARS